MSSSRKVRTNSITSWTAFLFFLLHVIVYRESSRFFCPEPPNYFNHVAIAVFKVHESNIQGIQHESMQTFRHTCFKVSLSHSKISVFLGIVSD